MIDIDQKSKLIGIKLGSRYGVLDSQFIQFDPEFNITLSGNGREERIDLSYNPEYIPGFFGKEVGYISGIVGKNGVGKSTIIRYIKDLFQKDSFDLKERENDIIFFLNEGIIYVYANERFKENMKFGGNETKLKTEFVYYRKYPKIYDRLRDFTTVFYSNSLDQRERDTEATNLFNISTNFLSENIGKINRHLRNKKIRNQSGPRRFRFTELIRQIDFINAISNLDGLIDIPFRSINVVNLKIEPVKPSEYRKLVSNIDKFLESSEIQSNYSDFFERVSSDIMNLSKKMDDYRRFDGFQNKLFLNVFENLNFYLLKTLLEIEGILKLDRFVQDIFERLTYFDRDSIDERILELSIRNIREIQKALADVKDFDSNSISHNIKKVTEQLKESENFFQGLFELTSDLQAENDTLKIPAEDLRLRKFLKDFFGSSYDFSFLSFSWPSLSAGESSLIAFFSRLYSILEELNSDNILLLIDEGDLYFHPEWQRDYIYFLLEFFKKTISSTKNISIILTTHSPFLLSDLPSENVLLLKREYDQYSKIISPEQFEIATFGGNIHALFSKAFFLDESTVSRFAKNKIKNEIIRPLESKEYISNKNELLKLINKIGEPVLKFALIELFEKRYDTL